MQQTAFAAKQAEKKQAILKSQTKAFNTSLLAGALPFIPTALSVATGLVAGVYSAVKKSQLDLLNKPIAFADEYENVTIADNDIIRSTYLGQGVPFVEWRNGMNALADEHGLVTPNDRRRFANETYDRSKPIHLSDDLLTRHMAIMAGTGSFKTELIKSLAAQQIRKGGGLIVVEAKSDSDFAGSLYNMTKEADRLSDLRIINFEFPDMSHTYNPFMAGNARVAVSTAMKIQASGSEEFWKDLNRFALTATILALKLQPGSPAFHIKDMIAVCSNLDLMETVVARIDESESEDHLGGKEYLLNYLRFWWSERDSAFKYDQYKDKLLGLVSKLSAFGHSEYSKIVNTYNPDVDLKEAILQGHIVVLSMSALNDQEGTELFAKLFIADLARAVGEIQLSKQKPLAMCPVFFDEYGSFGDVKQLPLFQMARSANVPIIIAMQGRGFLDQIDETFGDNALGNCWNHIYGDVKDVKTRQYACELSANVIDKMSQISEGVSQGSGYSSASSGLVSTDNDGSSTSVGYKESKDNLLQPNDFQDLDTGDAILVAKSGTYRLRLPMVKPIGKIPSWHEMELCRTRKAPRLGANLWKENAKLNQKLFNMG